MAAEHRRWRSAVPPFARRRLLVAFLFLGLAVVELWSPIVHGGWNLPSDLGQLYPLTRAPNRSPRAKNPLQSDVYFDFAPFLHLDVEQARAGHLATWNPYNGNGQPYLADNQTVVLSPFTFIFYAVGFRLALLAAALARLWLLGFFTFLFLARHRLGELAAVVGGVVFAYAGYHLVWLNYQTHVSVSACLPVGLWCIRVALDHPGAAPGARRRRTFALCGLAVVLAAMVLSGHPETLIFEVLLLGGYAAVALGIAWHGWRAALGWTARLAGAAALGLGLSAVQLLPFAQYAAEGARPLALRTNPSASVAGFLPDTVPMMAFPNLFGGPHLPYQDKAFFARHAPQINYAEVDGNSIGLLALGIAPLGVAACWRRRRDVLPWFAAGTVAVGSVFLYTRWAGILWHHVPLVGAAGLNRSQDIQLLGLAILAALGTDWVTRSARGAGRRRAWAPVLWVVASFVGVGALMLALAIHLRGVVSRLPGNATNTATALRLVHGHLATEVGVAAGFVVVLAAFAMSRRGSVLWGVAAVLGAFLAFASNGLVMRSYNPTVTTAVVYPQTAALHQLQSVVGSTEALFAAGSFPSASTGLWFHVYDVGSYDAIGLRWHDDLYRQVFGAAKPYIEQMPQCANGLDLFGVQWVVGGTGTWSRPNSGGLARSGSIDGVPYYAVPGASPFQLVGPSMAAPGDRDALQAVSSCSFDPGGVVVIDPSTYHPADRAPLGRLAGRSLVGASVGVLARGTTSAVVRTRAATSAWLVIREAWAPGWKATVDGRAVTLHRADVAFQAVRVPAGVHVVRLTYEPTTVTLGTIIAVASLIVLLGLVTLVAATSRPRREDDNGLPARPR
jgi:Bacterial membrane protein YfhO